MSRKSNDDLASAAARALELISSSAQARSQTTTPHRSLPSASGSQLPPDRTPSSEPPKHADILDIFMSPSKPKSRLRQMAESSAKKYPRPSMPGPALDSPVDFVLDLGTPSQSTIDTASLAQYKPPGRRSVGPRRSSLASKRAISPVKVPKVPIERLLDNLDILDSPSPPKDAVLKARSPLQKSSPPVDSSKPEPTATRAASRKASGTEKPAIELRSSRRKSASVEKLTNGQTNRHKTGGTEKMISEPSARCKAGHADMTATQPLGRRKSRRVTIVRCSDDEGPAESVLANHAHAHTVVHESVGCGGVQCESEEPNASDSESDSFDPTSLIPSRQDRLPSASSPDPKPRIRPARRIISDSESDDASPSSNEHNREPTTLAAKRIISDSEDGSVSLDEHHHEPSRPAVAPAAKGITSDDTSPSLVKKTNVNEPASASLVVSYNKHKPVRIPGALIDVEFSESDDSIEILPSREAQFQATRNKILATIDPNSSDTQYRQEQVLEPGQLEELRKKSMGSASRLKRDLLENVGQGSGVLIDLTGSDEPEVQLPKAPRRRAGAQKAGTQAVDLLTGPDETVPQPAKDGRRRGGRPKKEVAKKEVPFAKRRDMLAAALVEQLDAHVFGGRLPELEVVWSKRLNTTAGRAKWTVFKDRNGKPLREQIIVELGTKVIDCEQRLKNTLAHELCHVATWVIDRQKDEKHGRFFKAWARKVHKALPEITVTTRHEYAIAYKFNWRCAAEECTMTYGRHSNSIKPEKHVCVCGGRLVAIARPRKGTRQEKEKTELLIDLESEIGDGDEEEGLEKMLDGLKV